MTNNDIKFGIKDTKTGKFLTNRKRYALVNGPGIYDTRKNCFTELLSHLKVCQHVKIKDCNNNPVFEYDHLWDEEGVEWVAFIRGLVRCRDGRVLPWSFNQTETDKSLVAPEPKLTWEDLKINTAFWFIASSGVSLLKFRVDGGYTYANETQVHTDKKDLEVVRVKVTVESIEEKHRNN